MAAADRKIPVFGTAAAAFAFLWRERWTIVRLSWFPMLLATLAERLAQDQAGIVGSEFLTVAAWAVIAVSLHRVILFGDRAPGTVLNVRFGKVEALFVVAPLLYLAASLAFDAAVPNGLHFKGRPAMAMWIVMAVVIFFLARFCLAFPIAVVERRIDFAQAWALTHGNVWRMIFLWLLVTIVAHAALGIVESLTVTLLRVTPAAMSKEQFEDSWLRLLALEYPFSIIIGALCVGILSLAYKALAGVAVDAAIGPRD